MISESLSWEQEERKKKGNIFNIYTSQYMGIPANRPVLTIVCLWKLERYTSMTINKFLPQCLFVICHFFLFSSVKYHIKIIATWNKNKLGMSVRTLWQYKLATLDLFSVRSCSSSKRRLISSPFLFEFIRRKEGRRKTRINQYIKQRQQKDGLLFKPFFFFFSKRKSIERETNVVLFVSALNSFLAY